MDYRSCRICNQSKVLILDFYKSGKYYQNACKTCSKELTKRLHREKREQYKKIHETYRERNREKINSRAREWQRSPKRKAYMKEYEKLRKSSDVCFKLSKIIRDRVSKRLKKIQQTKSNSPIKDLGCSLSELKFYLESKFQPGMTWDNHGYEGWHLDHITPLASFDLTDPEQYKKACHYSNLQPLWKYQNLKKGDKHV